MAFEIRPIAPAEYDAWNRVPTVAFSGVQEAAQLARWRTLAEFERTLAAIDGDQIVGTATGLSFTMTVPGGASLPTGGVTAVAVLPTHRRRGVLTQMMRRQLTDFHDRGEPLGALWASESGIYGRFGYGLAIPAQRFKIARVHSRFSQPQVSRPDAFETAPSNVTAAAMPANQSPDTADQLTIVDRAEALDRFPPVYERMADITAGMVRHRPEFWSIQYGDGVWNELAIKEEPFLVVYTRAGADEGYLAYKVDGERPRTLTVSQLVATTPQAHEALWRYLVGVDLIDEIEVGNRAIDDALPWMLADIRRLERQAYDTVWLRLVDVAAALAARAYSADDSLTIEVTDPACPWNTGTHRLEASGSDSACSGTNDRADLVTDAATLAAIYLGATPPSVLARAGRITGTAESLSRADAMFRTERAPWCALSF